MAEQQFSMYILYSAGLDSYYIGSTGNLSERLRRHNTSSYGYTRRGKPWALIYTEKFPTRAEAMRRERQIKAWKNRSALERLIQNK